MPGQGQGQGQQGQGQGQSQSQGQGQGQGQGQSQQSSEGKGSSSGNYYQSSQTAVQTGSREVTAAKGRFLGLPQRDRRAIEQSQAEKYPQEYGAAVEQYFQNLANGASK